MDCLDITRIGPGDASLARERNGKIPEGLYRLRELKYVWVQDTLRCNYLSDCTADAKTGIRETICANIGNLRKLLQVLINNNPLGGPTHRDWMVRESV